MVHAKLRFFIVYRTRFRNYDQIHVNTNKRNFIEKIAIEYVTKT